MNEWDKVSTIDSPSVVGPVGQKEEDEWDKVSSIVGPVGQFGQAGQEEKNEWDKVSVAEPAVKTTVGPVGPFGQVGQKTYQPKPADIKIELPKPAAPGPYGQDIAQQQAREKQNKELYGEKLPHGKDLARPIIAGVLNIGGALAELPKLYSQASEANYQQWEKHLNDLDSKATNDSDRALIAEQRARLAENKRIFTAAKTAAEPVIKPVMQQVSGKLWDAAEVVAPMADQANEIRKQFSDIESAKPELIPDLVNSVKLGNLDMQVDLFAAQAAARGDNKSADELRRLASDYRKAQGEEQKAGVIRKALRGVARMAPGLVGSIALSSIPIVGPAAGFSMWAAQGAGQVYREALDAGADPQKARIAAGIAGPIYAGIETIQIGKLKRIPGVDVEKTIKSRILNAVKEWGFDTGKEVNEEGLQGIVTTVAGEIAKGNENVDDIARKSWQSYLDNVKSAALSMAIVGAPAKAASVFHGPAGISKIGTEAQQPTAQSAAVMPPPAGQAGFTLTPAPGGKAAPAEKIGQVGPVGQVGPEIKNETKLPESGTIAGKTLLDYNVANAQAFWALPGDKRDQIYPQLSEGDKNLLLNYQEALPPLPELPVGQPAIPSVEKPEEAPNAPKSVQTAETQVAAPKTSGIEAQKRVTPALSPTVAPVINQEVRRVGPVGRVGREENTPIPEGITDAQKEAIDKLIDGGHTNLTKVVRGKAEYYRLYDPIGNDQYFRADSPVIDYIKYALPKTRLPVQEAELIGQPLSDQQKNDVDALVGSGYKYAKLISKKVGTGDNAQSKQVWKVYNDLGQAQYIPAEQMGVINYLKDKAGRVQEPAFRMAAPGKEIGGPVGPVRPVEGRANRSPQRAEIDRISDRQAEIDTMIEGAKDPDRIKKRLVDTLLGDYGVTTKIDMEDSANQFDAAGIPYTLVSVDVGNLKAVNDVRGSHIAANKDLHAVLGDVWATEVRKAGGIPFRTGGDELGEIWPGRKASEVESVRAGIEKKIRQKRDELGWKDTVHARHGLPTGALHTDYAVSDAVPGKFGESWEAVDRLSLIKKNENEVAIAKEKGYTYNKESKKYEQRKNEEIRSTPGQQPGRNAGISESKGTGTRPTDERATGSVAPTNVPTKTIRQRSPSTRRPFEVAFPIDGSVTYSQEYLQTRFYTSFSVETYNKFKNGWKDRNGVVHPGSWQGWFFDYMVLADRPGKSKQAAQHKVTDNAIAYMQDVVDRHNEDADLVGALEERGIDKPTHPDDVRGWLEQSMPSAEAPYQKNEFKRYHEQATAGAKESKEEAKKEENAALDAEERAHYEGKKFEGKPEDMRAVSAEARDLAENLGESFGFDPLVEDVQVVVPNDEQRSLQKAFLALLGPGRGPHFISISGRVIDAVGEFNGVTLPDGRIFINVASAQPALNVLAHEALHSMKTANPIGFRGVMEFMDKNLTQLGEGAVDRMFKAEKLKDRRAALEEIAGDLLSDNVSNPRFWRMLYAKSPALVRDLLNALKKAYDNILSYGTKNKLTDKRWFKDAVAVRRELARFAADTIAIKQGKIQVEGAYESNLAQVKGEARFSRERENDPDQAFVDAYLNGLSGKGVTNLPPLSQDDKVTSVIVMHKMAPEYGKYLDKEVDSDENVVAFKDALKSKYGYLKTIHLGDFDKTYDVRELLKEQGWEITSDKNIESSAAYIGSFQGGSVQEIIAKKGNETRYVYELPMQGDVDTFQNTSLLTDKKLYGDEYLELLHKTENLSAWASREELSDEKTLPQIRAEALEKIVGPVSKHGIQHGAPYGNGFAAYWEITDNPYLAGINKTNSEEIKKRYVEQNRKRFENTPRIKAEPDLINKYEKWFNKNQGKLIGIADRLRELKQKLLKATENPDIRFSRPRPAVNAEQYDIFGGTKTTEELEREERQRMERGEVARRAEERKGGEANMAGLPLFEDQDFEGSPQTLRFSRERVGQGGQVGRVGQKEIADKFFSPVLKAVQGLKQERGTGEQMFAMITKTPGVKEAEWKWMGLDDFLKGKQSVTKKEIEEFVQGNQVRVEEVEKGMLEEGEFVPTNDIEKNMVKDMSFYKRSEFEKYKNELGWKDWMNEFVDVAEDAEISEQEEEKIDAYVKRVWDKYFDSIEKRDKTKFSQYSLPGGTNYREVMLMLPGRDLGYRVPAAHQYGDAADINRVAHVRLDDRTGPNGEKVLFVEEIQSDWAREAREKGIKGTNKKIYAVSQDTRDHTWFVKNYETNKIEASAYKNERDAQNEARRLNDYGVPAQPFLKNWEELVLKRVLRMAAEEGYDRVAWINGEQTAARYDLSKQVSKVVYQPESKRLVVYGDSGNQIMDETVEPNEIEKHIGKEPARRLLEQPVAKGGWVAERIGDDWRIRKPDGNIYETVPGRTWRGSTKEQAEAIIRRKADVSEQSIEGEDLKIGGEWATNLYDRMIPKFLEKYGKRWQTKVENVKLGESSAFDIEDIGQDDWVVTKNGEPYASATSKEDALRQLEELGGNETKIGIQQSIPITPEMRESVLYEGQPMFMRERVGQGGPVGRVGQIKNALSKRGITGDDLLNELDKLQEIKDGNGVVDEKGYVELYHRTTPEAAQKIVETGMMTSKEDGIFFSTKPTGQAEGYGDTVVKVSIPIEKLEVDDVFEGETHLSLPTKSIGKMTPVGMAEIWKSEQLSFSRKRAPKLGEANYTPTLAPEIPAEERQRAKHTQERAREMQDEISRLRSKTVYTHATDGQMQLRADLELKLRAAELSEQEADAVRSQIYDYAKALGLRGLPYNQVDTLLKNSRTAGDLRKAIERLDRIWEVATRREAVKDLYDLIDRKYKMLRALQVTRRPATTDLENNRLLQEYLDRLIGLNKTAERDHVNKMLTWLQREGPRATKGKELHELPDVVREWVDDPTLPLPDVMSNALRGMFKDQIETMPTQRLKQIAKDIQSIEETGKTDYEKEDEARAARREQEAGAVAGEIGAHAKKRAMDPREKAATEGTYEATRKRRASFAKKAEQMTWAVRDIDRIGVALTGKIRGSAFENFVIRPLAYAYSSWKRNMHEFEKFMSSTYGKLDMERARKKKYVTIQEAIAEMNEDGTYKTVSESGEKIWISVPVEKTIEEGMFIYAHSKNLSQREHLVASINPNDRAFADTQITKAIDALPAEYKAAVEKQWEYFDKVQWPMMNHVFSKLRQVDMDKEEFYMPVNNLENAFNDETIEVDLLARAGRQAAVRAGSTEARIVSGSEGVTSQASPFRNMLYFDVVLNNMRQAAHYNAMALPVYEVQKVVGNARVKETMDRISPEARKNVNDWMRSLAYGKWSYGQGSSALDTLVRWLRTNAGSYQILGRVSSLLIQASSMPRGMIATKKKYLLSSIGAMISKGPVKFIGDIDNLSANMATRTREYEQAITEYMESTDGKRMMKALGIVDKTKELLGNLIGGCDKFWASLVWQAKFTETINAGAPEDVAVYEADKVLRKTQSGGGLFAANALQRGPDVHRAFTQFMSDAVKATNLLDEYIQGFKSLTGPEKANFLLWGMLLPAAIVHLIRSGFEPWRVPEEGLKEFLLQSFYSIPLVGQVMELGVNIAMSKIKRARGIVPAQGWKQYAGEFEAPSISIIGDMSKAALKVMDGRKWQADPAKNLFNLFDLVALGYGLPGGGQVKRVVGGWDKFAETKDMRYFLNSKVQLEEGKESLQKQSYARTIYENDMDFFKKQNKEALDAGDREKADKWRVKRDEYRAKHFQDVLAKEKEFREKKKNNGK